MHTHAPQPSQHTHLNPPRDPGIAYLLWLTCFVGVFGVHRFYAGKWFTGIIWLFTFGLLGIGQLIDLLLIPTMTGQTNRKLANQGRLAVAYP